MSDPILKNPPKQLHALSQDMHPVEDVASLIEHIVNENRFGDLVTEPDDLEAPDPMALFNEISSGGSW